MYSFVLLTLYLFLVVSMGIIIDDLVHIGAHDLQIHISQGNISLIIVQKENLCSSITILPDGFVVEAM